MPARLMEAATESVTSESWKVKVILLTLLEIVGGPASDMYDILNTSHPLNEWDHETDVSRFYLAGLLLLLLGPFGTYMLEEEDREGYTQYILELMYYINLAKVLNEPLVITPESLLNNWREIMELSIGFYSGYGPEYDLEYHQRLIDSILRSRQDIVQGLFPSVVYLPESIVGEKLVRCFSHHICSVTSNTTWLDSKSLRTDRAIGILDLVDQVAAIICIDKSLLEACIEMGARLYRETEECGETPASLFISGTSADDRWNMVNGGSYADVYTGMSGKIKVALKVSRTPFKDFYREAAVLKQLNHPNIMRLLGIDRQLFPNRLCLVIPWMEGGNIMGYLRDNPTAEPLPLIHQVSKGLAYMHSLKHGLIHGDIKGENVLIERKSDDTYQALLADFGFSDWADRSVTSCRKNSARGTLRWMAPELLDKVNEREPNKATDIYAFGMTIYQIITGDVPFSDFGLLQNLAIVQKVKTDERPQKPLETDSRPGMFDDIWALIVNCWKPSPKTRLAASDVETILWEILYGCSSDNSTTYSREFILGTRT